MTAPVLIPAPADEPEAVTIDWLLTATRNGYDHDYRAWGRAAAALATEYPDLRDQLVIEALNARCRKRMTREALRTADGIARVLADAMTGQVSAWPEWTDPRMVREEGERAKRLGKRHIDRGNLMIAVADAMDLSAEGTSARDAWVSFGGDPSALDEAEEATGTDG